MVNCLEAVRIRYYSKSQLDEVKGLVGQKLDPDITSISREMLCVFHDILIKKPCCYWNEPVFKQTYMQLNKLLTEQSSSVSINYDIFEHFFIGYSAYNQITDIINDLENLNDNPEIKNRLYRIPTYVSIVEGCLTNLFRFILLVLNQTSDKDYASQKKLDPICKALQSNGFNLLVKDVNTKIRNAINHGGINFKEGGREIDFIYNENRQPVVLSIIDFEFDQLIYDVYDVASGVLLGICSFLNDQIDLITINKNEKSSVAFALFGLEMSIPTIRCNNISGLPNNKQLNLSFYTKNTDRTFILQTAIEIVVLVHSRYGDYKQYMISFNNERLLNSWIRFTNQDVIDLVNRTRDFSDVIADIIKRQNCLIFDASTEDVDLHEVKYFRFPNYSEKDFRINKVEDGSLPDKKRLKAHLFIEDISDKEEIVNIINKSIEWLKTVKNPPSPLMVIKHGTMAADSIYINVYRTDSRKNKSLFSTNENFVCFVDYNIDGKTSLKNGGIGERFWKQLYHEKIENISIAWRENKYLTKRNVSCIGVNEPCPCGSGKKYKKCCIDK